MTFVAFYHLRLVFVLKVPHLFAANTLYFSTTQVVLIVKVAWCKWMLFKLKQIVWDVEHIVIARHDFPFNFLKPLISSLLDLLLRYLLLRLCTFCELRGRLRKHLLLIRLVYMLKRHLHLFWKNRSSCYWTWMETTSLLDHLRQKLVCLLNHLSGECRWDHSLLNLLGICSDSVRIIWKTKSISEWLRISLWVHNVMLAL